MIASKSNLMFLVVFGPCYWFCKAGPPLGMGECSLLDVHFLYVKRDINFQSFCSPLRIGAVKPSY